MSFKRIVTGLFAITLIAGAAAAVSMAAENLGAEKLELFGGKRGKVPFPHHQHQKNLDDCQICHSVFPQKTGAIEKLKAEGSLKKKYVMNKLCTKCHREKKKAGQPSGPTSCAKCHIKPKK
ncbi:MAG: cytochrome c3 family protein [Desulfobacterales bacterium]|nr:cytochrome c3 family protein [Desulfobacterales bacterium]